MYPFKILSREENEELLKIPAYITILAANSDNKLDKTEEEVAIEFDHTKTFSSDPLLSDFYEEADKVFAKNLIQLNNDLPKAKEERGAAIKKELTHIQEILAKLGSNYVSIMHKSMNSFQEHVKKAHHSGFTSIIFPIPISGLTD